MASSRHRTNAISPEWDHSKTEHVGGDYIQKENNMWKIYKDNDQDLSFVLGLYVLSSHRFKRV